MNVRRMLLAVLVIASPSFAQDPVDPRVKAALEQANDIPDFGSLNRASVQKTKKGWLVSWAHEVGDAGADECTAEFNPEGALQMQRCRFEYVSHSMDTMNARWFVNAEWKFDATGKLTGFQGTQRSVLLTTKKAGVNRNFTNPADESVADLCKPLMKLDAALRQ